MSKIAPTAMVLAAGFGTRLRPLTLSTPKPLLKIAGKSMLDHALDKLIAFGFKRVVVNAHYLASQIEGHLSLRHDIEIIISRESEILDTGGGIKNAVHYFEGMPFLAINSDPPWFDKDVPALQRLYDAWNAEKMDALLSLMPKTNLRGVLGSGDFMMDDDGRVWRKNAPIEKPYVWVAAQIVKPELYIQTNEKAFSNNVIWNKCEACNKLSGVVHNGSAYLTDTVSDYESANAFLIETGMHNAK